ncbi:hypothetical protein NLI96_g7972 [Meripilus lineatus]|uniref:F-box domain-containing protein n=1 Tax=Meripilus lineatus TaxID=2056292 RepID=A0AAD5UY72_9APHY|nr:hypothetical protein NLI96_g7972 [Physisporinus lineatus]
MIISSIPERNGPYGDFDYMRARTLCACSLVCRSWASPSRIHLFRYVRLTRITAPSFIEFIENSPVVGAYVERITFEGEHCPDPDTEAFSDDGTASSTSDETSSDDGSSSGLGFPLTWLHQLSRTIRLLLPKLCRVEYAWFHLPPHFHASVRLGRPSSVTSLNIREVDFESFVDFIQLLCSYDCLEHLTINHPRWIHPSFEGVYHFGQRWGCTLKSLNIFADNEYGYDICYWFAKGRTPRTAESLRIFVGDGGFVDTKRDSTGSPASFPPIPMEVLNRWTTTLKRLDLSVNSEILPSNFKEYANPAKWILSESDVRSHTPSRKVLRNFGVRYRYYRFTTV